MVHFFIGTKAQFIKMAPVMVEMNNRGLPFRYIDSGQHADLTRSLRKTFGIREPDVCLSSNTASIASIMEAFGWYLGCRWRSLTNPKWLKSEVFPGGGICLIHGDTLSTLLGMNMAVRAGLKVAHIEAGLRSFDILSPFPEELIRIRCMKRSDLLFAPSDQAFANLLKMGLSEKASKISGNTIVDALRLSNRSESSIKIPDKAFALATCHRLETIARRERLAKVVSLLNRVAREMPVLFVVHRPTGRYLERFDLVQSLRRDIRNINMLDYNDFVTLERAADIVLTDGGSIQEECSYLNKPCLILRNTTERSDGLGRNAVLWRFDEEVAESFLSQRNRVNLTDLNKLPSPSSEIIDALIRLKYIN